MTEPKKTTRRRTRARSTGSAPIELKPSNGHGEVKVQKAVAALEEISVSSPEPAAEKNCLSPRPGGCAERAGSSGRTAQQQPGTRA
jgi:hypothetical protein